jgi:hypothetical protein
MATVDSITPRRALNVEKELAALQQMTVNQLREKYLEIFGEPTNSRHKQWLIKRTIWRMQANAEGDLPERARRRALEIANDADLRRRPPSNPKPTKTGGEQIVVVTRMLQQQEGRVPLPGGSIVRDYKGQQLEVFVRENGFEYAGELFKSLSAVAKHITGSHCNGFHFFRLTKQGGEL